MIFGNDLPLSAPRRRWPAQVRLVAGLDYPAYRLVIIGAGLAIAALLYLLVPRREMGAPGAPPAPANREMATAMGVDIKRLFTFVFGIGAGLCAVAGALLGPLLAVQVGMGESILILAFVVISIGGIGSIRGALVGALLVGLVKDSLRAHGDAVDVPRVLPAAGRQRRWPGRRLGGDLRLHGSEVLAGIKPERPVPGARLMATPAAAGSSSRRSSRPARAAGAAATDERRRRQLLH